MLLRAPVATAFIAAVLVLGAPLVAGAQQAPQAPLPPSSPTVSPEQAMLQSLGSLERQAVESALSKRKLVLEPSPEGKVVGQILVANLEVFSERDGFLQWFNFFHITTREGVVAREVLLAPGDPWNQALVDESVRNLRDPYLSNVVAIVPVKSTEPGKVDLLVVTRDVWSLRLNSSFEVQGGNLLELEWNDLLELRLSVSENNLFGLRKKVAFSFAMDQGDIAIGPTYIDDNIAGTHLTLVSAFRLLIGRESGEVEGQTFAATFSYPLWSLAQKWGASIDVAEANSIVRSFRGNQLRVFPDPTRPPPTPPPPGVEPVPWEYRYKTASVTAGVVRSFGRKVVQRVRGGYQLDIQRPSLLDDFPGNALTAAYFEENVFPLSERASGLFASYALFTPDYRVFRDLDTFDLREDVRFGPGLDLSVGNATELLGSELNFVRLGAAGSWTLPVTSDGLVRVSAGFGARVQDGELINRLYSTSAVVATPQFFNLFRAVASFDLSWLDEDTQNRVFVAGGGQGLRGYIIGFALGSGPNPARVLSHVELRSAPVAYYSLRVGGVLFWDAGDAADDLDEIYLYQDVGIGLRTLIPQLDPYVMRLDLAFPFVRQGKGFPGRFTLGFKQVF